ncbi:MAG: response regulator [Chloroflexota bacterium]
MGLILAVGSQPELIEMITVAVRGTDYQIHRVKDPGKVPHVVESVHVDAVIVDIHETGKTITGMDVAEAIREQGNNETIVIAVSDESADKYVALAAGFDAFLVQPFDFSRLRATLQMYLSEAGMTLRT